MPQNSSGQFDLDALARLAKLKLDDSDRQALEQDIAKIIEHFDRLKELDVKLEQWEPSASAAHCPLREDEAHHDAAVANKIRQKAPKLTTDHFEVPPVIPRKT